MNYRHLFHAGNFADVFKHVLLAELLGRLTRKERPIAYVESHAGAGFYRLDAPALRRSSEWKQGIGRLSGYAAEQPALARFLALIAALAENQEALRAYPGSPLVAAGLTRPADRLYFAEREPEVAEQLARLFRHDERVAVHCRDGYEALGGLLPPKPRAGLLLVDPPYESPDDFQRVVQGLAEARRRWPEGVLAAWYPIKDRRELAGFYRRVAGLPGRTVLRAELTVGPADNTAGLNGCGLAVVDPPWGTAEGLGPLVAELRGRLSGPGGDARVDWLRGAEEDEG